MRNADANIDKVSTVNVSEDQLLTPASEQHMSLQVLHRVTWKSILQVLLLILTVAILVRCRTRLSWLSSLMH